MTGFKLNHVYRLKKKYHESNIILKMAAAYRDGRADVSDAAITAKHVIDGSIVCSKGVVIVHADDFDCFDEYKPFKVNGIYKLRDKYVDKFKRNEYTRDTFGDTAFTFTVDKIIHGLAYVCTENGQKSFLIACSNDRHMFKRIDNK